MAHILVVDDELAVRRAVERVLRAHGHSTELVESGTAALAAVATRRPELVLLDLHMKGLSGMETLDRLSRAAPGLQMVMMTAMGSIDSAVMAFKRGAVDFVTKPFDEDKLLSVVTAALPAVVPVITDAPTMVGKSSRFVEALALALRFARPDINILLEGDTGTGKELFARAIHASSKRHDGPFIPVDCSTLSESLMESELFGHERGAFTGATATHVGHFERAHGGTLFLDEIGNLTRAIQAKLLRIIQERTLERVGGHETVHVDIRIISAANVDMQHAVRRGVFRMDLYYRLAETTVRPPTLRERQGDVTRLARHFVLRYAAKWGLPAREVSPEALELLESYAWPGNVRELENVIKSAVVLADQIITPEHFPASFGEHLQLTQASDVSVATVPTEPDAREVDDADGPIDLKAIVAQATETAERSALTTILRRRRYNLNQLAHMTGLDPKTLRIKLRKYGLDK